MTQPKTPPLSVRLSEERIELIDAFAHERSISRHSAVVALIDLGLGAASGPTVEAAPLVVPVLKGTTSPKGPPKLAVPSTPRERMTMDDVRPPFVSRLKGDAKKR